MDLKMMIAQAHEDTKAWFPAVSQDPFFMAACMVGEGGELLNHLKKVVRGTHVYDATMDQEVAEEIADVFTYMLTLCGTLNIDLEAVYWNKREKNAIRFAARKTLEGPDNLNTVDGLETRRQEFFGNWQDEPTKETPKFAGGNSL